MSLPPELTVFLIAMSPIVELRGAIPLAVKVYGLPLWQAYFLGVTGNLVPLIGIVVFGPRLADWLSRENVFAKNIFDWLFDKTRKKTRQLANLGKDLTVIFLTALPIPFVGGWTGALAAFLLEIPVPRGIVLVTVGALSAGLIVSALTIFLP